MQHSIKKQKNKYSFSKNDKLKNKTTFHVFWIFLSEIIRWTLSKHPK